MELGSDVRSVSFIGGLGDLDGLEWRDTALGDLDEGKEERDVRRGPAPLLPLESLGSVVPVVALVDGRCIACRGVWRSLSL